LQIIGAGFGRTGTHSLGLALQRLGLGPSYTTTALAANPEHTALWKQALEGGPVDWEALFGGYRAALEWPAVGFLPELIELYPDAKVVLTLRDPEAWYESARETIFQALKLSAQNPDPVKRERSAINRRLILERTFDDRFLDKEHALEVYRRHQAQVVERVPPERLLQFDVRAGWGPLCEFLDLPAPDEPFPYVNRRADFLASTPAWAREALLREGAFNEGWNPDE